MREKHGDRPPQRLTWCASFGSKSEAFRGKETLRSISALQAQTNTRESRDSLTSDECTLESEVTSRFFAAPVQDKADVKMSIALTNANWRFLFSNLALIQSCAVLRASPCTARSTASLGETQIGYWISRDFHPSLRGTLFCTSYNHPKIRNY